MPSSECLNRKWDEYDVFPTADFERLFVFPAFGDFERITGVICSLIDEGLLQRIDDGDVKGRILVPNPSPDENVGGPSINTR